LCLGISCGFTTA
jgi:hypothetical protein